MKAITLHQPWASLIAHGFKQYETRSWKTPYRGPIAIHAGKHWTKREYYFAGSLAANERQIGAVLLDNGFLRPMPLGAVVCVCELVSIHRTEDIRDHLTPLERELGNYAPDRFAWKLKLVERYDPPLPVKGSYSLWEWHGK